MISLAQRNELNGDKFVTLSKRKAVTVGGPHQWRFEPIMLCLVGAISAVGFGTIASAQTSASPYTTGYRWDAMRRLVGEIKPDPDGAGPLLFPAVRYRYDADGQLEQTQRGSLSTWQSQTVAPKDWTGFTIMETVNHKYSDVGNLIRTTQYASDGTPQTVTQFTYDVNHRLDCTAIRMNPAIFATTPSSACTHGAAGAHGADRITRQVYNSVGLVTQVIRGFGTPLQQNYATYTYSPNGNRLTARDANNNETQYAYDGFDRLEFTYFVNPANGTFCTPPATPGGTPTCTGNQTYERAGYDKNGNQVTERKRTGQTITYTYDALNRKTFKDFADNVAARASDVSYGYDLLGRQLHARFDSPTGPGVVNTYDKAGRHTSTGTSNGSVTRSLTFIPDQNGNRIRTTFQDGTYIQYDFDGVDRMTHVRENGAASGLGLLATYSYDNLGRRARIERGNGTISILGYDGVSRLNSLSQDLPGTANDLGLTFTHNPANQIRNRISSNDAYKWTPALASQAYVPNALNQYSSVGGVTFGYDASGNLTSDGSRTFTYDAENRLRSMTGGAGFTLDYDPSGRLNQTITASVATQYLYDGDRLVGEFSGNSTTPLRRYIHGAASNEPLLWYEGSGTTDRRWLHKDERGTVVASTNSAGATTVYTYGPFGEPTGWTGSRFRYTGQIALPEAQLYHYKARVYDPRIGRFLQVDPIGNKDDLNLYTYVGGDPLNRLDPSGQSQCVEQAGGVMVCTYEGAVDRFFLRLYAGLAGWTMISSNAGDRRTEGTGEDAGEGEAEGENEIAPTNPDEAGVPPEISAKIPVSWGQGQPNRKKEGWRWEDPEDKGNSVRWDKGDARSRWPSQREDHVRVTKGGKVIGPDGQPINPTPEVPRPAQTGEAHIPASEYGKWLNWGEP